MQIRPPGLDELARRWPEIEPILRRATRFNGGRCEPIDLLQAAMRGEIGIYLIEDDGLLGAVAVKVVQYPRKRELLIDHIAGRGLAEWWPLLVAEMDRVARERECGGIMAYGRPGWVRFWRQRGVATRIASEIIVRAL